MNDRIDVRVVFQGDTARKLHEVVTRRYGGIKGAISFYVRQAVQQALEQENKQPK